MIALACAFGLMACGPNEAVQNLAPEIDNQTTIAPAANRPDGTKFSDVLQEYKDLNDRLIRLLAPLRLANTDLCPKTQRDPGFITHRLDDYPPHLRGMAKEFHGLSESGVFIRSVRRGSPAQSAQIQQGDQILAINDKKLSDMGGATQASFYAALSRNAFNGVRTRMTLQSAQGKTYTTKVSAQTACDIPASVIFSDDINGHTDGREIFITSALMRSVGDDVNLSLVLAHEMSHIIASHTDQDPSAALELEADRMALVLMQNAGLDIDRAISFWRGASHPHAGLQDTSKTHPSITARYENFRKEQRRVRKLVGKGKALDFE